jgi:hypothetical protein
VTWKSPIAGDDYCLGRNETGDLCPFAPIVRGFTLWRLQAEDGAPLSALATLTRTTPWLVGNRLRFTPVAQQLSTWSNPFGPAAARGSSEGFYSDGEVVRRFPLSLESQGDSVATGAFPAVSADDRLFASSVAVGVDSTSSLCRIPNPPTGFSCVQENVMMTYTGWETIVVDRTTGAEVLRVAGLEPLFDPVRARIVVRRPESLVWVDLETGSEDSIDGTAGVLALAISPDGSMLAFSRFGASSIDLFVLRVSEGESGANSPN